MRQFAYPRKTIIVSAFFSFVLIASLSYHLSRRMLHYQELDSTQCYKALRGFPDWHFNYLNWAYPSGSAPIRVVETVLNHPLLFKSITLPFLNSFPFRDPQVRNKMQSEPATFIRERLNEFGQRHWLALVRFSYISVLRWLRLPFVFQSAFLLPFGSTYSSGVGVIYGLLLFDLPSYEVFMSRAVFLTISLFHLGALILFATALRAGAAIIPSSVTALLYLFSISHYSYGYHLGSTIWNVVSGQVWLWALTLFYGRPQFLRRISLVSGILVFFNYLIAFFWLSFFLTYLFHSRPPRWPNLVALLKTQLGALFCFGLCGALFFQPGQSNRGSMTSFHDIPKFTYYILLNFFSFFNQSRWGNFAQFALAVGLLGALFKWQHKNTKFSRWSLAIFCGLGSLTAIFLVGAKAYLGATSPWDTLVAFTPLLFVSMWFIVFSLTRHSDSQTQINDFLKYFSALFLNLVLLTMAQGTLGFSPSRHILFISPVLFLGIALAIAEIPRLRNAYAILGIIVPLGCAGIQLRTKFTTDLTKSVKPMGEVAGIIPSLHNDAWHVNVRLGLPVIKKQNWTAGRSYFYVSQTRPLTLPPLATVRQSVAIQNLTYFIAYNPLRSIHTRPNSLYVSEFTIGRPSLTLSPKMQ